MVAAIALIMTGPRMQSVESIGSVVRVVSSRFVIAALNVVQSVVQIGHLGNVSIRETVSSSLLLRL
jgi:hypothetical protein